MAAVEERRRLFRARGGVVVTVTVMVTVIGGDYFLRLHTPFSTVGLAR